MGQGIKAGIIVEIIVLVAAIGFSVAYFNLNLYHVNHGFDILLIMLWVFVAAVLLIILWWRSLKREEMRRRFYLSSDYVYNFEIGYAPLSKVLSDNDEYALVSFLADSLVEMSYGFDVADVPEKFNPLYLISTETFRYRGTVEEGIVIDRWRGDLQRIEGNSPVGEGSGGERTYMQIGRYGNARELADLLIETGAFA